MNSNSKIIVKKFGGMSLASTEHIKKIAKGIADSKKKGNSLVIVVSAMGDTTNELFKKAQEISRHPARRELDMLLSAGERISMALLCMALHEEGVKALSLTGSQSGIITSESHQNAEILNVIPTRIQKSLNDGYVVVVAGYQGVSKIQKEITTLGRGGSDTTAVALAAALGADHCQILKEVSGIFNMDPKLDKNSLLIESLDLPTLYELTLWGAKVLHHRSVEYALRHGVSIYIGNAKEAGLGKGSWATSQEQNNLNTNKPIALNSIERVILFTSNQFTFEELKKSVLELEQQVDLPSLVILEITKMDFLEVHNPKSFLAINAPLEWIEIIAEKWNNFSKKSVNIEMHIESSVTLTFNIPSDEFVNQCLESVKTKYLQALNKPSSKFKPKAFFRTQISVGCFLAKEDRHFGLDFFKTFF